MSYGFQLLGADGAYLDLTGSFTIMNYLSQKGVVKNTGDNIITPVKKTEHLYITAFLRGSTVPVMMSLAPVRLAAFIGSDYIDINKNNDGFLEIVFKLDGVIVDFISIECIYTAPSMGYGLDVRSVNAIGQGSSVLSSDVSLMQLTNEERLTNFITYQDRDSSSGMQVLLDPQKVFNRVYTIDYIEDNRVVLIKLPLYPEGVSQLWNQLPVNEGGTLNYELFFLSTQNFVDLRFYSYKDYSGNPAYLDAYGVQLFDDNGFKVFDSRSGQPLLLDGSVEMLQDYNSIIAPDSIYYIDVPAIPANSGYKSDVINTGIPVTDKTYVSLCGYVVYAHAEWGGDGITVVGSGSILACRTSSNTLGFFYNVLPQNINIPAQRVLVAPLGPPLVT